MKNYILHYKTMGNYERQIDRYDWGPNEDLTGQKDKPEATGPYS